MSCLFFGVLFFQLFRGTNLQFFSLKVSTAASKRCKFQELGAWKHRNANAPNNFLVWRIIMGVRSHSWPQDSPFSKLCCFAKKRYLGGSKHWGKAKPWELLNFSDVNWLDPGQIFGSALAISLQVKQEALWPQFSLAFQLQLQMLPCLNSKAHSFSTERRIPMHKHLTPGNLFSQVSKDTCPSCFVINSLLHSHMYAWPFHVFLQGDKHQSNICSWHFTLEYEEWNPMLEMMSIFAWISSNDLQVCKHCALNHLRIQGALGAQPPLAPRFFQKSCSFQVILKENPYFEQMLGSGPPPWRQNCCPLTKILDPPLPFRVGSRGWVAVPHRILVGASQRPAPLTAPVNTVVINRAGARGPPSDLSLSKIQACGWGPRSENPVFEKKMHLGPGRLHSQNSFFNQIYIVWTFWL